MADHLIMYVKRRMVLARVNETSEGKNAIGMKVNLVKAAMKRNFLPRFVDCIVKIS